MSVQIRNRVEPRDHVVLFYERDDELVTTVSRYLVDAVLADETAIVVATADHTDSFEAAMAEAGIDVAATRMNGRLVTIDAGEALSRFLVDDWPDADAFAAEIGGRIRQVTDTGRRVRVYGEMVALLWRAGNVGAAIELETLWNDLGRHVPFSLFCAYPARSVAGGDHEDSFSHVCRLHSEVVSAVSRSNSSETSGVARADEARSFRCDTRSPSAARQFVARTLKSWGLGQLVADASVVVSELATNAVVHARSDFIVALSSRGDTIRVSIRDASSAVPLLRDPPPMTVSGRGLVLVSAIARSWGTELVGDGKLVWVDLCS